MADDERRQPGELVGDTPTDRARDRALRLHHEGEPDAADLVGEAAGGISGTLAGAVLGSLGGPIGTVIGGIAGAVGGWWAGRAISEAAHEFTEHDDSYFRAHYAQPEFEIADLSYEQLRPAYQLGHLAARNPDYQGKRFEEIEDDLKKGWNEDLRTRHGEWAQVRRYAEAAYARGAR